ncbi:MAG: ATP-binding protein, partial [Hyphomicrobiaceae bacterium]
MIPKAIRDITPADLQGLIKNSVREGKTIEYKRQLPGPRDEDKREFLADASSFANASGGDLLFGLEAKDGAPTKLVGVDGANLDSDIQRLENLLRSGLEPRLPHCDIVAVELGGSRSVVLLRIPQSWSAPHRVIFREHSKFYGRNSAGKYPLDVGEIRIAFTASEALGERIRRFREERLAKIVSRATPVPVVENLPTVVLHT